jgi:hypothetical protein
MSTEKRAGEPIRAHENVGVRAIETNASRAKRRRVG